MALNKKGSRRITVDGSTYRWRVRRKPSYRQGLRWTPMTYAVEAADEYRPGAALVVTTSRPHPGNWVAAEARPLLPAHVAADIREARRQGWDPARQGRPFPLDRSAGFRAGP